MAFAAILSFLSGAKKWQMTPSTFKAIQLTCAVNFHVCFTIYNHSHKFTGKYSAKICVFQINVLSLGYSVQGNGQCRSATRQRPLEGMAKTRAAS